MSAEPSSAFKIPPRIPSSPAVDGTKATAERELKYRMSLFEGGSLTCAFESHAIMGGEAARSTLRVYIGDLAPTESTCTTELARNPFFVPPKKRHAGDPAGRSVVATFCALGRNTKDAREHCSLLALHNGDQFGLPDLTEDVPT